MPELDVLTERPRRRVVFDDLGTAIGSGEPLTAVTLPAALQAQLRALPDRVDQVAVTDTATYEAAALLRRDVLTPPQRAVKAFFQPLKQGAHGHHRALCDAEESILARLNALIADVDVRMLAYEQRLKQERDAAARLRVTEQAATTNAQVATRVSELLAAGDVEAAERLLDAHDNGGLAVATPPPVPVVVPTVKGVGRATTWKAIPDPSMSEDESFAALVRWVAERPQERRQYLRASQQDLDAAARAQRRGFKVPGYIAQEVTSVSVRSVASVR